MTGRRPRRLVSQPAPEEKALVALSLTRRGYSLRRAADLTRTDPRTVLHHAGSAFRKEGRRWVPRPFDRIPRRMTVLTAQGPEEVVVRDSRTASLLADHANAVARYVERGDESRLDALPRRRVWIGGRPVELATDPNRLDRLAAGGELSYELYRH